MVRILITDDHAVVQRGLQQILADEFPLIEFGQAEDALAMLKLVCHQPWDIVILDITMPGVSGLDVLKDLKHERPHLPVLMLTAHPEDQYAMRVLRAGADGFINKESAPDELVKAVQRILAGGKYISPSLAERLASTLGAGGVKPAHEVLSDREYQIFCMIALGKTSTQIAVELSISAKTVSTHRTRLMTKMNLHSNAELTRYAIKNDLID